MADFIYSNFSIFITFILTVIGTVLSYTLIRRRGVVSCYKNISFLGSSIIDDAIKITWKDNPVAGLYHCFLKVTNESFKDYKDVIVKINSAGFFVREISSFKYTQDYLDIVSYKKEDEDYWLHNREYIISVLNRGDSICFEYLVAVDNGNAPNLDLIINHSGISFKNKEFPSELWGVPHNSCLIWGTLFGVILVILMNVWYEVGWIYSLIIWFSGYVTNLIGVLWSKGIIFIQDWLKG